MKLYDDNNLTADQEQGKSLIILFYFETFGLVNSSFVINFSQNIDTDIDSMSKIIGIFLNFFSLKNTNLRGHYLFLTFFNNIKFYITLLPK